MVRAPVAQAATEYWFNSGADAQWTTLTGNWWDDAGHTIQSPSLPDGTTSVITEGSIGPNIDLDVWTAPAGIDATATGVRITSLIGNTFGSVTGDATFNNASYLSGFVTGNATFNNTSHNNGFITLNATFNNSSVNIGSVTGNATFNNTSSNEVSVSGNATFNDSSFNQGTVSGDATFTYASSGTITLSGSQHWGTVSGTARDISSNPITQFIFNGSSVNNGTATGNATFNNSSQNTGTVSGDATFNNNSIQGGTISGDATFNDSSVNSVGIVSGNATFNDSSFNNGGTISTNATFNDSSYNGGTVDGDATFTYVSGDTITLANGQNWGHVNGTPRNVNGDPIIHWIFNGGINFGILSGDPIFNKTASNQGIVTGDAIFNSKSTNFGDVTGNATFNDLTENQHTISGNASFLDSSVNGNTISGNACFSLTATNNGTVDGITSACSASLPSVTTSDALSISSALEGFSGSIDNTGGESNSSRGFDYGPDISYGSIVSESDTFNAGGFSSMANSLTCNTTYHYRAFATNSAGTGHGSDATFTTASCSLTPSTLYGVDGAGQNPDPPNLYTLDPATGSKLTTIGPTGHNLTGLAFDPNGGILYGVSGGKDVGGKTKGLFILNTTTGAATWQGALKNGANQAIIFPDISFRSDGRLYGFSNAFGGDPTTADLFTIDPTSCNGGSDTSCLVTKVGDSGLNPFGNGLAFDKNDNLYFFGDGDNDYWQINPDTGVSISNPSFSNPSGSTYSINAASFNENNVLFASRLNFGSSPSDLVAIDLASHSIISTGDNADMQYMDALAFSLPAAPTIVAPTVSTSAASNLSKDSVTLNGNMTDNGGEDASSRGFNYGLDTNYGNTITQSSGPYATGTFSADLSDLTCNTTYHFRSFAVNTGGTGNGSDASFKTATCLVSAGRFSGGRSNPSPPPESKTPPSNPPPTTPPLPIFKFLNDLSSRVTHPDVKALQKYLNNHGFPVSSTGPGSLNNETDFFGAKTKAAIILFQKAHGLVPDGILGPKTRGVMNSN